MLQKLIGVCVLLLMLLPTVVSNAQQEIRSISPKMSLQNTDMPYIQYYSLEHDGIVIESADGSDRRMIAKGAVPASHNYIRSYEWSQDGQWLAFISEFQYEYNDFIETRGSQAHLVALESQKTTERFDQFDSIVSFEWLRIDGQNQMVAIGSNEVRNEEDSGFYDEYTAIILDVDRDKILFELALPRNYYIKLYQDKILLQPIAFHREAYTHLIDFFVIHKDLQVDVYQHSILAEFTTIEDQFLLVGNYASPKAIYDNAQKTFVPLGIETDYYVRRFGTYGDKLLLSASDGAWIYEDGVSKKIEVDAEFSSFLSDTVIDDQILFGGREAGLALYHFGTGELTYFTDFTIDATWSPSGRYILSWHQDDEFTFESRLELYDRHTKTTIIVDDQSLNLFKKRYGLDIENETRWFSPDEHYLIYATLDETVLYDITSQQYYRFPTMRNIETPYSHLGSYTQTNPIQVMWGADNIRLLQTRFQSINNPNVIPPWFKSEYFIDLETFTFTNTYRKFRTNDNLDTYLIDQGCDDRWYCLVHNAMVDKPLCQGFWFCLIEWDAPYQAMTVPIHSWRLPFAYASPEITYLDASKSWFLLSYKNNDAFNWDINIYFDYYGRRGDPVPFEHTVISNGTLTRDVNAFFHAEPLPDRVSIAELPHLEGGFSVEQRFTEQGVVRGVTWSPNGQQILIGWSTNDRHSGFSIWDVATQTRVESYELEDDEIFAGAIWMDAGIVISAVNFYTGIIDADNGALYPISAYHLQDGELNRQKAIYDQGFVPDNDDRVVPLQIYMLRLFHLSNVIYWDGEHAIYNFNYQSPVRGYDVMNDGSQNYVLLTEMQRQDLSYAMITDGDDYLRWLPPMPSRDRTRPLFAINTDETYTAHTSYAVPLSIYADNQRVAIDHYFPHDIAFHPTLSEILAVAVSNRVEIVSFGSE